MAVPNNPYAHALDGLELADPVRAFFDFCREREAIRERRESGAAAPWSDDPVFQRGRFLNVFREDDRGSRAIRRFVEPLAEDLPRLVHALFFARWCNRQATLDQLVASDIEDVSGLGERLQTLPDQPWCNVTAYPVEAIDWEGRVCSRFDTATRVFYDIREALTNWILSAQGDVVQATRAVNERLKMKNDFPIFMAVMDIAWFRPDVIDPASPVPTGIGAVAFLDRLESHLGLADHEETCARMIALQPTYWPEARRPLQPIDIEYLSCECRKYYSYINGTKRFEGKNIFRPDRSPRLLFDLPEATRSGTPSDTRIVVLAGGPCSGKSTLGAALAQAGYPVEPETAERVLEAGLKAGRSAEELRAEPVAWQEELLRQDFALFDGLPSDDLVFSDTSFIETVVFAARAGIDLGPGLQAWLARRRYHRVFFLEPLAGYEQSAVRMESRALAMHISDEVQAGYRAQGYELIRVPAASVVDRLAFILSALGE
jgi:predicted ATPase